METLLRNIMEEEDDLTQPEPEKTPPPKKGMVILYRQHAVLTLHVHVRVVKTGGEKAKKPPKKQ